MRLYLGVYLEGRQVKTQTALAKTARGTKEHIPAGAGTAGKLYVESGGMAAECREKRMHCLPVLEEAQHRIWWVLASNVDALHLPVFGFPAWALYLDGKAQAVTTDQASGLISLKVPTGLHKVELRWHGLWQENAGTAISLVSALLLGGVLASRRKEVKRMT